MEKLNQTKIAGHVGVSPAFINMIFKGIRRPSWKVACRLGELFSVSASFWMEATPEEIQKLIDNYDRPIQ